MSTCACWSISCLIAHADARQSAYLIEHTLWMDIREKTEGSMCMRVAIVGGGAIGCFLAARLSEKGHNVVVVARSEQLAALQRDGLLLRQRRRVPRRYWFTAVDKLEERPDIALLTVKSQDVTQACREMLPAAAGVPVVAMQNGLQGDGLAASVLGSEVVLGCVVMCAATYLVPGEVSVEFPGWLIAGEPYAVGAAGTRARAVAALLNDAVPTYVTSNLTMARWSKLLSNLNNALSAATGLPMTEIMRRPASRALPLKVMREGYMAMRAAGLRLDGSTSGVGVWAIRRDPHIALVALLQGALPLVLSSLPEGVAQGLLMAAAHGPLNKLPIRGSTWQSIARARATEIDYLNGEIVCLGQRHGIPTPFNSRLVEAVHAVERTHMYWRPEELWPAQVQPPAVRSAIGRSP